MTPALAKLNFTAHVTTSVAWCGAVASFLVLSIAALTSHSLDVVRGAYLAMNVVGAFVIVPLSVAALLTGMIQSLGTQWGLFRQYWVVTKLVLTIGATLLLLLHQFKAVAGAARRVSMTAAETWPDVGGLGTQLVGDAGLALFVLLVITVLGVYKPWGPTRYGLRKQRELRGAAAHPAMSTPEDAASFPPGLTMLLAVIGAMVFVFGLLHHVAGGMTHGH
jgi:hypothetical protein